jgi:hypothetical protein
MKKIVLIFTLGLLAKMSLAINDLPIGFYAQIIEKDTIYYGVFTENADGADLDYIIDKAARFGALIKVTALGTKNKRFKNPSEVPANYRAAKEDIALDYVDFNFSVPAYNFIRKVNRHLLGTGTNENPLMGFFFNKSYPYPMDAAALDPNFFTDFTCLDKVIDKFKDTHLSIVFDGKTIDTKKCYAFVKSKEAKTNPIRSIIVNKKGDQCQIEIETRSSIRIDPSL